MNLGSRQYLFLFLAAVAVVAVACGSEDGAGFDPASIIDAGAATAVAAASDIVPLVPISADMDNEPEAFLDAIPEAERKCLEELWGDQRYADIRSGDERLNDESLDIFKCITGETWSRVIAGGLFNEIGVLSVETTACVATKLGDGRVAAVADQLSQIEGEPTLADYALVSVGMVSEIIPVSFCLNEEERDLIDAESQFGTSMTISDLECLYDGTQSLGLDFSTVFQIAPSDYEPSPEYLQVALDCGFPVTDGLTQTESTRSETSTIESGPSTGTPDPEVDLIPIPVQ